MLIKIGDEWFNPHYVVSVELIDGITAIVWHNGGYSHFPKIKPNQLAEIINGNIEYVECDYDERLYTKNEESVNAST